MSVGGALGGKQAVPGSMFMCSIGTKISISVPQGLASPWGGMLRDEAGGLAGLASRKLRGS